ncbi:hypothetical protein M427DRAFT_38168 [Gonapodya prolifera JEL478]|uniref:Oxysterol-binding protein n=1 Tax=Gonapodya prolifera (strain JEL478) TaxID=1344416 RepID=A0A138ZZL2_GONPJ|nr:hypothetical protein M427DRAFT_38168 [Gonapodya prolifera JEL478]|eukprot:KXS09931.1 hypothetical protein M427DRAFT_38168 [Gonapodya prolifera JEL478]
MREHDSSIPESTRTSTASTTFEERTLAEQEQVEPITVEEDTGAKNTDRGERGRLQTLLGFLKESSGVKDITNVRVSLPASACDPLSGLEYFTIMDHPQEFVKIAAETTPEGRMLAVVRFVFSSFRLHMNKIMKSFNPVLGETYRCHWEVDSTPGVQLPSTFKPHGTDTPPTTGKTYSVDYRAEQLSHHPPKGAFWYRCKELGVELVGLFQVVAQFTGLAVRINHRYGMTLSITLPPNTPSNPTSEAVVERYRITQPNGELRGLLVLSPYVALVDYCVIVCRDTKMRTVIRFKEDSFFSLRSKFEILGNISRYNPDKPHTLKSPSLAIDDETVLYTLSGSWKSAVSLRQESKSSSRGSTSSSSSSLIDMSTLPTSTRILPPLSTLHPTDSRIVWQATTTALATARWSDATRNKAHVEDAQRDKARTRPPGWTHTPRLFRGHAEEWWWELGPGPKGYDAGGGQDWVPEGEKAEVGGLWVELEYLGDEGEGALGESARVEPKFDGFVAVESDTE